MCPTHHNLCSTSIIKSLIQDSAGTRDVYGYDLFYYLLGFYAFFFVMQIMLQNIVKFLVVMNEYTVLMFHPPPLFLLKI